jgi:DNA invertase Pin-like site-specific DNA recombinase
MLSNQEAMKLQKQKRVAIYARVSTNSGQDPAMQLRELREYCVVRNWQICREYIDKGVSGARESRPELDRLMAEAHRRKFDVVACWKFDRFARSVSHLLRSLELFGSLGMGFVSLSEQIDTGTPTGKLVFTVLGAVAELERSLIGERVRAGLRNAKAKGKRLGRTPLRVLSPTELRALRQDRQKGISFKALAQKHGVSTWSAFHLCKAKY